MATLFYTNDAASLRRTWLPLLAWGIGFIGLGLMIVFWAPQLATAAVYLLGGFSVLAGLIWVGWALSLRHANEGVWMATVIPGILLIAFGAFVLVYPDSVRMFFLWVAGGAAIAWALVDMVSAWRLRRFFPGWWLRLLRGALVAVLGLLVIGQNPTTLKAFAWALGLIPITIGVVTIWMAIWVRRLPKDGGVIIEDSGDTGAVPVAELGDGDAPAPPPEDDDTREDMSEHKE